MGNTIKLPPTATATGKVILPNGTVHAYHEPLTVAELMLEYPQQVVIEFQQPIMNMNMNGAAGGNYICKRPAPLPADKKLEMNKVYLMIPMRRGKPAALSSEETRRILLIANSFLKSKSLVSYSSSSSSSSGGFLPLFARICAAGTQDHQEMLMRRNELHIIQRRQLEEKEEEEASKPADYFSEILMEERPEFLSRQISGKGWKPSLDTITEKTVQNKVRHWLFWF